ncbi:MAG TPA: sigma-70 family RNA polymerase sigma factor [Kofleriaceae bacterium]|nr:sigma-70 family RNA polymerase sigma factor [Kofleriaceae bacterium]
MSERAFTQWVSRLATEHTRGLAYVAQHEGLSGSDAVDAVQEAFQTFLTLPRARRLVDERDDSAKLLAVLVRNVARNARRRHHRAVPHLDVEELALADAAPSVDELLMQADDHVRLMGCVTRLTEVQRHIVELRFLDEASTAEITSLLGITPGHIAVLLFRAKQALVRCMEA